MLLLASCQIPKLKPHGFTMHGLMVCLAIVGILLSTALPSMADQINKTRARSIMKNYIAALELARTTAISESTTVTFCRSADGQSCTGSWNQGAIVFTDTNADRIINGDDRILLRVEADSTGNILWRAFQNRQYLQIVSRGFIQHQSGNFTFCPVNGDARLAHQLVINSIGRIRISSDQDGDGIVENAQGEPLTC